MASSCLVLASPAHCFLLCVRGGFQSDTPGPARSAEGAQGWAGRGQKGRLQFCACRARRSLRWLFFLRPSQITRREFLQPEEEIHVTNQQKSITRNVRTVLTVGPGFLSFGQSKTQSKIQSQFWSFTHSVSSSVRYVCTEVSEVDKPS